MTTARTSLRSQCLRGGVAATLTAACVVGIGSTAATSAGFVDRSYASAQIRTESAAAIPPAPFDQSFSSSLFISRFGELYAAGYRGTGDGNGSLTVAGTAQPNKVKLPEGIKIVNAAGSTNDFSAGAPQTTSYMALDSNGGIWTWGTPYGGPGLIGRGPYLTYQQAAAADRVTQTATGDPLPKIADMSRSENQFLALDYDGRLWAWGYGGENLPQPSQRVSAPYPFEANQTAYSPSAAGCATGTNAAGAVRWRSVWGGNNSAGAVGQNGLVYTWGWDNSGGMDATITNTLCPTLNEGANRAVFAEYPNLYRDASGRSFDPSTLTNEADRHQRYLDIVAAMKDQALSVCAGVKETAVVDTSECPVREMGFGARAPRLLLQNGMLLTWQVSNDPNWGPIFLGRPASTDPNSPNYSYSPAPVTVDGSTSNIDRFQAGVSSVMALTTDGRVFGWGTNDYCQAVGAQVTTDGVATGGSCSTSSRTRLTAPVSVQGLPNGIRVTDIRASQCAAWAETEDGNLYAWGGGLLSGYNYASCITTSGYAGYKIYDYNAATDELPFGAPVTAASTGTKLVRGDDE